MTDDRRAAEPTADSVLRALRGAGAADRPLARAVLASPLGVARALLALERAGLADARRACLTPAGEAAAAALDAPETAPTPRAA